MSIKRIVRHGSITRNRSQRVRKIKNQDKSLLYHDGPRRQGNNRDISSVWAIALTYQLILQDGHLEIKEGWSREGTRYTVPDPLSLLVCTQPSWTAVPWRYLVVYICVPGSGSGLDVRTLGDMSQRCHRSYKEKREQQEERRLTSSKREAKAYCLFEGWERHNY